MEEAPPITWQAKWNNCLFDPNISLLIAHLEKRIIFNSLLLKLLTVWLAPRPEFFIYMSVSGLLIEAAKTFIPYKFPSFSNGWSLFHIFHLQEDTWGLNRSILLATILLCSFLLCPMCYVYEGCIWTIVKHDLLLCKIELRALFPF